MKLGPFAASVKFGDLVEIEQRPVIIDGIENPRPKLSGIFLGSTCGKEGVQWPNGLQASVAWVLLLGDELDGRLKSVDWSRIASGRILSIMRDP